MASSALSANGQPPARGAGPVPMRRPGSVRRTITLDVHWPEGRDRPCRIVARSRDFLTAQDGAVELLDRAEVIATVSPQREVLALTSVPNVEGVASLASSQLGGRFRGTIRDMFPDEADRQGGLYQLLDDLPGAMFLSGWGWICWNGASEEARARTTERRSMVGVCTGLAAGSPALDATGFADSAKQSSALVEDLVNPRDPLALHDLPDLPAGPAMRRSRWIDVWRDGDGYGVASGYQDSARMPQGGRRAVHEYRLQARLRTDGAIVDLDVEPLILPYVSCPAAALKARAVDGTDAAALRMTVPRRLAREEGCTHLNDVLRALSAVPSLAMAVPAGDRAVRA